MRAALLATAGLAAIGAGAGSAETIGGALVKAYLTNPDINTQRAAVRQTDEGVPEANAGYLPNERLGNMAVAHVTGNQIIPGEPAINYSTGAFPRGYGVHGQRDRLRRQPDDQLASVRPNPR